MYNFDLRGQTIYLLPPAYSSPTPGYLLKGTKYRVVCPNFGLPVQTSDIYLSSESLNFAREK